MVILDLTTASSTVSYQNALFVFVNMQQIQEIYNWI